MRTSTGPPPRPPSLPPNLVGHLRRLVVVINDGPLLRQRRKVVEDLRGGDGIVAGGEGKREGGRESQEKEREGEKGNRLKQRGGEGGREGGREGGGEDLPGIEISGL